MAVLAESAVVAAIGSGGSHGSQGIVPPSLFAASQLDFFNVHVTAEQLASARANPGQWFDCTTDKERYGFIG